MGRKLIESVNTKLNEYTKLLCKYPAHANRLSLLNDVFQVFLSALYSFNDDSSRWYDDSSRLVMILETVARVRFCVLMLKSECDDLITEMFQIFFRTIRDYHPDTIFTAMETIMTQILGKSNSVSQ